LKAAIEWRTAFFDMLNAIERDCRDRTPEDAALVNNVTPTQLKGCIYQLTPIALEIKSEFEEHCKFLTEN